MPAVRAALSTLATLEVPLWRPDRATVLVDANGQVHLTTGAHIQTVEGQLAAGELLDLIAPFSTAEGARGPDLQQPRPELRIVPGRLSGSPHIVGTRIETRVLAALLDEGYSPENVASLYPYLSVAQIAEALELERQLTQNLRILVAA